MKKIVRSTLLSATALLVIAAAGTWLARPLGNEGPADRRSAIYSGAMARAGDPAGKGAEVLPESAFSGEEFQASLHHIASDPDAAARDEGLRRLAGSIPEAELANLVSLLARDHNETSHDLWIRLLRRWAAKDPRAAIAWMESLPASEQRKDAGRYIAMSWAAADLDAAAGWVSSWPEGEARQSALTAVAYEGARTNPVAALGIAADLPWTQENENLINYATAQWAVKDPSAAARWARAQDAAVQPELLSGIAATWADKDPAAAAALATEVPAGRSRADAIVGVAARWVQQDAAKALQWVAQLPEGDARNDAMRNMVSIGLVQDEGMVESWLKKMPQGQVRDAAIAEYVTKAPGSPSLTANWLPLIGDPALQQSVRESIGDAGANRP